MRRIGLAVILAVSLILAPLAAKVDTQESKPQPSAKIPLVGVLHPGVPDLTIPAIVALR